MKRINGFIVLFFILLSGCSSREVTTNTYEEHREERNRQSEIRAIYSDKEEAYKSELGEITFSGSPEDFTNIVLEVNNNNIPIGLPRYYGFIENENHLQLEVKILEGEPESLEEVQKTLTVDTIHFENEVYSVEAEDYTFELFMLQDSVKRLKDEDGSIFTPSHYIPEELQDQWWKEAEVEVDEQ